MPSNPCLQSTLRAALVASTAAGAALPPLPAAATGPLEVHGQSHPPACDAQAWPDVAAALRRSAGAHHPAMLQRLANLLLCGAGPDAAAELLRAAPRTLPVVSSDPEGSRRSREPAALWLSPRQGQAWDVRVEARGQDVRITFLPDEACLHTHVLRRSPAGWRFVGVEGACD